MTNLPQLEHIALVAVDLATLEARAPGVVDQIVSFRRDTLRPEPGGLFDEAIFGAPASLDPPSLAEDAIVPTGRATRFGRIVLCEEMSFDTPLGPARTSQIAVLPPDLRPQVLRDGQHLTSDLNVLYRDVLVHNGRLRKLREIGAPAPILDDTRSALATALSALVHNEALDRPTRDERGRVLVSLHGMLRPDLASALRSLDEAVGRGLDPKRALPLRWHRVVAVLFAMGVEVCSRQS